ncbi:MAG: AAA family ATPase [Candidatus Ancillula sp.]|jgi:AAA+ ATPase superfamily predicted ATPase|nr:AAA family ATPase [Candidatus Ancillula sp.]
MKTQYINPFNPQFGYLPRKIIGRSRIISDYVSGLNYKSNVNRTTILTGLRGSGKTALLSDIAKTLEKKKYIIAEVTAHDGMLEEILNEIMIKGQKYLKKHLGSVSSFTVGALGFSFGFTRTRDDRKMGFRHMLTEILNHLERNNITLVISVDEIHNDSIEMRELVIAYQHLIREGRDVSLLMAGLPNAVFDVLNDKVLTFLRRAHRVVLENLDTDVVKSSFENEFVALGIKINPEQLDYIAKASFGYPYLYQLIGFHIVDQNTDKITSKKAELAISVSRRELFRNIHDLVWNELSHKDKEFIQSMAKNTGEVRTADIASDLGVSQSYISTYRARLIDSGIIYQSSYGYVSFALPFMKEYIEEKETL